MATLGELMVKVGADISDFMKNMTKVDKQVTKSAGGMGKDMNGIDGTTKSSVASMVGSLKGLAGAIAGAFVVQQGIEFGKWLVNNSADLQALDSQYSQVMGSMEADTDKYLGEMSTAWNKHPNELKGAYMQYVALLKGKGVSEKEAHDQARKYMDLTVDANAFSNESMADTTARFMAGIKGEYDSWDTAMINVSQTMLNDKAQKEYGKKWEDLTVTQQENLKIATAMEQHLSSGVVGQAGREADSYANNLAMLKNTWGELMRTFGDPMLEATNNVLKGMIKVLKSIDFGAMADSVKGFFGKFGEGFPVLERIKSYFPIIKEAVQTAMTTVATFVQEKLGVVKEFWSKNGEQILEAVNNAWNMILSIIEFVMPAILFVVDYVWSAIKGVINGALNVIMGVVKVFTGLFTGDFSLMWEGIKQLFMGAIEFVWNLMSLSFVKAGLNLIKNFAKKLVTSIKGLWDDIALRFMYGKDAVIKFLTGLKSSGVGVWNSIKSVFSTVVNAIWNFIKGAFTTGKNTISSILTALKGGISTIWNAIKSAISTVLNAISKTVSTIWNGIKTAITTVVNGVKTTVSTVFNSVKTTISTIFTSVKTTATRIWNGIRDAITNPIETAKKTVLGIIDSIVGAFSKMKITIPKPKFPKIKISTGSKTIAGVSIPFPKFDVDWNAKGNIFNGATVLGGGQGVGEAGAEAVLPIQHKRYMQPFASAIASHLVKDRDDSKGDVTNNFNISQLVVREEADIDRIARQLLDKQKRAERRGGRG